MILPYVLYRCVRRFRVDTLAYPTWRSHNALMKISSTAPISNCLRALSQASYSLKSFVAVSCVLLAACI